MLENDMQEIVDKYAYLQMEGNTEGIGGEK